MQEHDWTFRRATESRILRQRARTAVGGIVDSCLARAVIEVVLIGCRLQARSLTRPAPAILRSFGGFCCGDAVQVAGEATGSCLRIGFGPNGGRVRGRGRADEVEGGVSPVLGRATLDRDLIASAGTFFCEWGRRAEEETAFLGVCYYYLEWIIIIYARDV